MCQAAPTSKLPGTPPIRNPGCEPRVIEHARPAARCRGLAMRAGNGQHLARTQHGLAQPLRTGNMGKPMIEHVFDHRVAARQGIAHDDSFGIGSQMRRLVPPT
jgi:hypothetical protein